MIWPAPDLFGATCGASTDYTIPRDFLPPRLEKMKPNKEGAIVKRLVLVAVAVLSMLVGVPAANAAPSCNADPSTGLACDLLPWTGG